MILIEQFLTENPFYTAGEKIQVKGIMLHSLGYAVSKPDSLMAVWNKPDFKEVTGDVSEVWAEECVG